MSEEALKIAEERREPKGKRQKERHSHDTENGGSRRNFIVSYN